MTKERNNFISDSLPILSIGLFLVAVVYFTPHAGSHYGKSFFELARHCHWEKFGEWAVAWGGAKILLLTLGIFFMGQSLIRLAAFWMPQVADCLIVLLIAGTMIGYTGGLFFFLKAVF